MRVKVSRVNGLKQVRRSVRRALALIAVICAAHAAQAQSSSDDVQSPLRGIQGTAAYSLGGIETVNTANGNLMLNIPLASLPGGRGGHSGYQLSLRYNSKIWDGQPDYVEDPISTNRMMDVVWIVTSEDGQGGWDYNLRNYFWYVENRNSSGHVYPQSDQRHWNIFKMKVVFPDGGTHEFRPHGHDDGADDGYYRVRPSAGMSYYSVDGTYARLDILSDGWALYFGDGTRVVSQAGTPQRTYDPNGNYTEINYVSDYNNTGRAAEVVTDQLGRSITVEHGVGEDYIHSTGVDGEPLVTTVKWGATYVSKTYRAGNHFQYDLKWTDHGVRVVKEIALPSQAGGLKYTFGYNGWPVKGTGQVSVGWGELSSVTLPSGARADYEYTMDNESGGMIQANWVLDNSPSRKTLSYDLEYDDTVQPAPAEVTEYGINDGIASIREPDGGVTTEWYSLLNGKSFNNYKTQLPDGTVIERDWRENRPLLPPGVTIHGSVKVNTFVEREFTSVPNAEGTLVKTAIKEYSYDKNGNVTAVREYDWVDYGSVPRGAPVPSWVPLLRETLTSYYVATPNALDSTTFDPDTYNQPTAPNLRSAVAVSQVRKGAAVLAYTDYTYDSPTTTGNLLEERSWDSTKGPLLGAPQDAVRLNAGNSVSVRREYDDNTTDPALRRGNLTLAIDANGNRTKYTYGAVAGPNGTSFTGLYPTTVVTAEGTSVQRTTSSVYDFHSGLVKKTTDEDNQISTSTTYDAVGRPKLVKEAEGEVDANNISLERRTSTEYSDTLRRVIVRADLGATGDGKLVSVMHYDQLGRLRLSRTLEDASTQLATDEHAGVKVQTRYLSSLTALSSYQLVSNPYRAARSSEAGGEETMGWSLTTSDRSGRAVRSETFGGSGLPAPFAVGTANSNTTGVVLTAYDANSVTVTDQAGRLRSSVSDAAGRVVQVFEAPNSADYNHQTSYSYDALGNLTLVEQGEQTRTFAYSSLSRMTSAVTPEACRQEETQCVPAPISYEYDANGNLKKKTDPRPAPNTQTNIQITYAYDELDRLKTRTYNDGSPTVTYAYDTAPLGKGRMTSVTKGSSTYSYTAYDALGRVTGSAQTTDGVTYTMPDYRYDLMGNLTSVQYPSGRVVKTEYDAAGRVAGVKNPAGGHYYAGGDPTAANDPNVISYTAHGLAAAVRLGNGLWERADFNSRLQVTQTRLGTAADGSSVLKLDYTYGLLVGGSLDASKNNGNPQSQSITVPGAAPFVQTYVYDELNRLHSAEEKLGSAPSWKQVFAYDRYGNRGFAAGTTSPNIQVNTATNQLVPDPARNPVFDSLTNRIKVAEPGQGDYRYDEAGNLLCEPGRACAQGQPYYAYDADNKMKSAAGGFDNGGTTYTYDGDGRRVKKATSNGEVTVFVYDALGRAVAEYSNQVAAKGTRYLTQDYLGSTRVVTDAQGNAHSLNGAGGSRHDYFPFGEDIGDGFGRTQNQGYTLAGGARQGFTGYEKDKESGLNFAQARYQHAGLGRFNSPDPYNPLLMANGDDSDDAANQRVTQFILQPQNWNRYTYAANNPLKFVDKDGRHPILALLGAIAIKAAVGAAAGAAAGAAWETGRQLYKYGEIKDTKAIKGAAISGAIFGAFIGAAGPVGAKLAMPIRAAILGGAVGSVVGGEAQRTYEGQETTACDVATDALAGAAGGGVGGVLGRVTVGKYTYPRLLQGEATYRTVNQAANRARVPRSITNSLFDSQFGLRWLSYGNSIPTAAARGGTKAATKKVTGRWVPCGTTEGTTDKGKRFTATCRMWVED